MQSPVGLGEGPGGEPSVLHPAAPAGAAAPGRLARGDQRPAGGHVPRGRRAAAASGGEGPERPRCVRGGARLACAVPGAVRVLPGGAGLGDIDLPRALRRQSMQRPRRRRRAGGRDSRPAGSDRDPAQRNDGRGACPQLRQGGGGLRHPALPSGAQEEAGGGAQRGAGQGAQGESRPDAGSLGGARRRRPGVREAAGRGAGRRHGGGGGGVRGGAGLRRRERGPGPGRHGAHAGGAAAFGDRGSGAARAGPAARRGLRTLRPAERIRPCAAGRFWR